MNLSRKVGTVSLVVEVFVKDSSLTTDEGKTGIAYNAAGLVAYYKRNSGTASVAITLATITTFGTFASGGFKEVDATNMPGVYEFHIPNAALASGADSVTILIQGASNMAPVRIDIELTAWDNQDGVRGGLTALPAAPMMIKKNQALANFQFLMTDAANHLPATGLAVAAQRLIDAGGAFVNCTNVPAEVSNGIYRVTLSASDLNGDSITFKFSAASADTRFVTVYPQP